METSDATWNFLCLEGHLNRYWFVEIKEFSSFVYVIL